ncbi:MAG: hypothetical protein GXP26_00070 [Planctomycetes bacterium]|nr:hypothetical protein [Planctomycetota bacterium]
MTPHGTATGLLSLVSFLAWATLAVQPVGALDDSILPTPERNSPTPAPSKVVESEVIFPSQSKHVHSSSIVELPDGSLLAAWFHGSGERKADDVCVMGARKSVDAKSWSEPFVLADTPGHPDCNPVLWIDQENQLWLFWSTILSNEWESSLVKYRISTDYLSPDGPPKWHWQDTVHIKPSNFQHEMLSEWRQLLGSVSFLPRAIRAELSVTTLPKLLWKSMGLIAVVLLLLLTPAGLHWWKEKKFLLSDWKRFAFRAAVCYSLMLLMGASGALGYFALQSNSKLNQRLGWLTAHKPIQLQTGEIVLPLYSDRFVASIMAITKDGGNEWETSQPIVGYGNIQPCLIERTNGQIVALMRENGARKRIRYSVSNDQGNNWSTVQETSLPNPGSKIHVAALCNGDWALAYNDLVDGRHTMSLAISRDEGETWQPPLLLDSGAIGEASFSYPCLLETLDGRLHLTYSRHWHHEGTLHKTIRHLTLGNPQFETPVSIAEGTRNVVR